MACDPNATPSPIAIPRIPTGGSTRTQALITVLDPLVRGKGRVLDVGSGATTWPTTWAAMAPSSV